MKLLSGSRRIFLRLFQCLAMAKTSTTKAWPRRARRSVPESRAAKHSEPGLQVFCIRGLPEIRKGDDLARLALAAARKNKLRFEHGDILVVAQKVISKVEGRVVSLASVTPSAKAHELAAQLKKDARAVELVLQESRRILRSERVLITETHHGFVCANAGIDHSNVPLEDMVALLPRDPDESAEKLA